MIMRREMLLFTGYDDMRPLHATTEILIFIYYLMNDIMTNYPINIMNFHCITEKIKLSNLSLSLRESVGAFHLT
jgi:hypothetical protein